jgi:hypothetical protein
VEWQDPAPFVAARGGSEPTDRSGPDKSAVRRWLGFAWDD